jgi:hypothetical protein
MERSHLWSTSRDGVIIPDSHLTSFFVGDGRQKRCTHTREVFNTNPKVVFFVAIFSKILSHSFEVYFCKTLAKLDQQKYH